MSNRPTYLLFISVNVRGKSRVRFFLPLPFFVVLALTDMLDDWGVLISLFHPRTKIKTAGNGEQTVDRYVRTITGTLFDWMWEVAFKTGPLDLVDVDVSNEREKVSVKVLTR